MRDMSRILIVALTGLLLGCETPSTAKQNVTPSVKAYYELGTDGDPSSFYMYLAEGKTDGPSISDAVVTLDNKAVTAGMNGYYYLFNVADPVAGATHTLNIVHPSFSPVRATVTVPSGPAPAFSVSPAPLAFPAVRNTSAPGTFTLNPTMGAWPASGVRYLLKGYSALNERTYMLTSWAAGAAVASGTYPVGQAERTGFEVRNYASVPLPGATSTSVFQIDGDQAVKVGFDPLTDIKPLVLILAIEKKTFSPFTQWNASQRAKDQTYLSGAVFQVDGVVSTESSTKGAYSGYVSAAWTDGSSHTYSIKDKDGLETTGTITMPSGVLTGVTYAPAKGTLAKAYTLTPPAGGWPAGSYIKCSATVGTSTWETYRNPSGLDPLVVDPDFLANATAVNFYTGFKNVYPLELYASGSQVSVLGQMTSW